MDGTGADGARSEGGRRILLDNSRVYVRFLPFVDGRVHLGRMSTGRGALGGPLEPRDSAYPRPPRLYKGRRKTWTCEYQRLHYPDGPQRRCSIHNRPTCPFSADDGTYAGHRKGPRQVSYKIKLRFRRFGCGTGQLSGLRGYYIAQDPTMLRAARPTRGSTISSIMALDVNLRSSARVPSPWTLMRSFVP